MGNLAEIIERLKAIRDHVLDDMAREMTDFTVIIMNYADAKCLGEAIRILEERGKQNQ